MITPLDRGIRRGLPLAVPIVFLLTTTALGQSLLLELEGSESGDQFGESVSGAGDVNGDGVPDLIVGAPGDDGNGENAGSAIVVSGADGSTLHFFVGGKPEDRFGRIVRDAGDTNGNGFDDLLVASEDAVRVLSGKDGAVLHDFPGETPAIAGAGDVDADDFDDILIGMPLPPAGGGTAVIYSGQDGSVLHTFGPGPSTWFGWSVDGIGDVDRDGFDDVIVGDPGLVFSPAGLAFVYSGKDGTAIHTVSGFEQFGFLVSDAGDVDGDGTPDFLATVAQAGPVTAFSGVNGAPLRVYTSDTPPGSLLSSIDAAGDVDGDGFDDAVMGSASFLAGSSVVRVFSGGDSSLLFEVQVSTGFFDPDVSGTGDVNQDGLADVVSGGRVGQDGSAVLYSDCEGGVSVPYGLGCPGSGEFVPKLRLFGCPTGGSTVTLSIEEALGSSIAFVLFGGAVMPTPLSDACNLLVSDLKPVVLSLPLSGGGPGAGAATANLAIAAGHPPGSFFLQAFVRDPNAADGFSNSNGFEVRIP